MDILNKKNLINNEYKYNQNKINYYFVYWNLQPELNMKRYVHIKTYMNLIDSIGGGWASVKNSNMAYQYLLLLYKLAYMINNNEIIIKCNIYHGHILLWKGKYKLAYKIINKQTEIADDKGYYNLVNRCDSILEKIKYENKFIK